MASFHKVGLKQETPSTGFRFKGSQGHMAGEERLEPYFAFHATAARFARHCGRFHENPDLAAFVHSIL
jgi:hypothetical protein